MRLILLLLFLFLFKLSLGQTKFSGVILDEQGQPLSSVSITLHKKTQPSILAFAISNKEGKFIINYSSEHLDSMELKASLLGYAKQSIFFFPDKQISFDFILLPTSYHATRG